MASAPGANSAPSGGAANIITALGNAFKSSTGDPLSGDRIAQLLIQNMSQLGNLAREGKLTQAQIKQLKEYADMHGKGNQPGVTPSNSALKGVNPSPFLGTGSPSATEATPTYSISSQPPASQAATGPWQTSQPSRPTLTGGIPAGRVVGTSTAPVRAADDPSLLTADDSRARRKNAPGDQSMRRSIQDLVTSIDPNVKIEPEVEDLLLDIADEFIDSVTHFGCRLAKHRGGDTLEVKDLQLHLERNHNIRIPGFASDETRISLSQTGAAPAAAAASSTKKGAQNTNTTLRSHRLAQVQLAKKEAKLM